MDAALGGHSPGGHPVTPMSASQALTPPPEWSRTPVTGAVPDQAHFAAERLAFADAAFDLVVVTLPVSHWSDKAAGLAGIGRVMAPGATLVVADVSPDGRFPALTAWSRHRKPRLRRGLPSLIAAAGFRVHHVEQVRPVALIAASRPSARQKRAGAGPSAPRVVVV